MSESLQFLNGDPDATGKRRDGYRVEGSGRPFSVQKFGDFKEMWFVPDQDMEDFYTACCNDLNNNIALYFTEKGTPVGQLRIDLDIKFDGMVNRHRHTDDQVLKFLSAYMDEAKNWVEIKDETEIYVLEKDRPTWDPTKKLSASGIHVQIPGIKSRAGTEQGIRRKLLPRMGEFFDGLEFHGNWDGVYDKQPLTHTNCWMVLGCKKNEGLPYKIRYILKWNPTDGEMIRTDYRQGEYTPNMLRKMSLRSGDIDETPLTEFGKANVHIPPEREVVPISGGRAVAPGRGRQSARDLEPASRGSSPGRLYIAPLSEVLLRYYEALVKNLSVDRAVNYNDWIAVGQCLKNIHPDLSEVWLDHSSRCGDKYNANEAIVKWNSFGFRTDGQKLGIGTLRFWSRSDNLDGYLAAENQNIDRILDESAMTSTEHDVARVVHAKYGDEFVCAKYGTNSWYQYKIHNWVETDRGVALQCRLSSDISKMYLDKEMAEINNIRVAGDCAHKETNPECVTCQAESRKRAFSAMRLKLKKTGFKKNVMDECKELFLDEQFAKKLDENKNLIAFANGVFDTTTLEFRDGKPSDCISFSTRIVYDPDRHYSTYEQWAEIDKFLRDVQPDPMVRNYLVRQLCTCLRGGNDAQKFHILTGDGSNGKSMLTNLMSLTMGDYAVKVPISLLTQKRASSASAAPEVMHMKGKRFATTQEPDEAVPLNTGLMKELASCEKMAYRGLYQGISEFEMQAKMYLSCNEKPKVGATDGGTWRRLCVVHWPSKFVANPTEPHHKPLDESIQQKVMSEEWATCFLAYLVELYKEGNGWRKLMPPEKVLAYTTEYQEDSDVIARFIREFITPLPDGETTEERVTTGQINGVFQQWKRTNEISKGSTTDLKKRLDAMFGVHPKTGWNVFRFESV